MSRDGRRGSVDLLARGHNPLGRFRVAAQLRMLVPQALAAGLGAIAADLAATALDAGVCGGNAARARTRGFRGISAVCRARQGRSALEGVEHSR